MDKLLAPNILCRRRRHLLAALLGGASGAVLTPPFAASAAPESLPVLGVMPELVGLTDWFNGSPLSRQQLMGKVVVVEHSHMIELRLIIGLLQKVSDLVMDQFKPMLLAKD